MEGGGGVVDGRKMGEKTAAHVPAVMTEGAEGGLGESRSAEEEDGVPARDVASTSISLLHN